MKRSLLISVAMLLVASVAFGQAGYFGVYSDPGGTVCTAADVPNGFVPIYIIHQGTQGAGAFQASLQSSNPTGFVHLGETSPYQTIIGSMWEHDDNVGGSVAYGACVASPNLVKTINVLTLGINPVCTVMEIVPDPSSLTGTIEVVDCGNNKLIGLGAKLHVNADGTCTTCEIPDPVEDSSWGRLKALYNK